MGINSSGSWFSTTRRWISGMVAQAQTARQAMGSCFGISQPLGSDTFSRTDSSHSQSAADPETVVIDAKNLLELFNFSLALSVDSQQTEKRAKAIAKAFNSNVKLLEQIDNVLENANITSAKANRLQRKVEKRINQQAKKLQVDLNAIHLLEDHPDFISGLIL